MKQVLKYITVFTVVILVRTAIVEVIKDYRLNHYVPEATEIASTVPVEIQTIFDQLGIKKESLKDFDVVLTSDSSRCGDVSGIIPVACYFPSQRGSLIIPRSVLSEPYRIKNGIIAHEYMHAVWYSMTDGEQSILKPYIEQVYRDSPSLYERVKPYPPEQRWTELHSYICTEMYDNEIPAPLLAHCVKYVPNRSMLPSLY